MEFSMVLTCLLPNWCDNLLLCPTGNLYMDSRQSMSMMGPPGYPHMTPMSSPGAAMTGRRGCNTSSFHLLFHISSSSIAL